MDSGGTAVPGKHRWGRDEGGRTGAGAAGRRRPLAGDGSGEAGDGSDICV